jgi:hypothetical protein
MKTIHISELMLLVGEAEAALLDFTVGFVKAIEKVKLGSEKEIDAVLAGSGVLVTGHDRYAILTAEHVLKTLPESGPVGLILLSGAARKDHQFTLEMEHTQKITVGRGRYEEKGPDLGLIILPSNKVSDLKVWKTFYNLSKRKRRMLKQKPAHRLGPWIMCGLIGEMTQELTPLQGMFKRFGFRGLCGPVTVPRSRRERRFDYFTTELNCGCPHGLPESFGGYSGSGVWHLLLSEHDGHWGVREVTLGGIAYYESAIKNGKRFIECHGPRSIYELAEEALAEGPK